MIGRQCPEDDMTEEGYYKQTAHDVDKEFCDTFLLGQGCKHKEECATYQKLKDAQK